MTAQPTTEPELKPCRCGRKALIERFHDGDDPQPLFVATCEVCPIKTYDQLSMEEATRIWNEFVPAPSVAPAVDENSVAFTAYNQAIEDAKAAIRHESQGGGYWAATFINAIARKCSPHVYVNRLADASPAPAAPVVDNDRSRCVACKHEFCKECNELNYCCKCDTEIPPRTVAERLAQHEHIEVIDDVLGGVTPLVSRRRISVHHILGYLYNGENIDHIAKNYQLAPEAIKDAIAFAQEVYDDAIDLALRVPAAATAAPAEQSDDTSAERDFLEASIAVWREIDRLSVLPDGYHGLKQSTDLRKRELAAWEAYRAVLDSTTPVAAPQEEVPIGGEVRSSRHPHFTHADHERMKETLDSLSDYPTEEEAEAVLQACGTSGKEVVNEFIERLLKENLELKTKLESVTAPLSTLARKAAEELNKRGFSDHELFATVSDERMKQIAAIIERCLFGGGESGE